MGLLSVLHDPKTEKYAACYTLILIGVIAIVILMNMQVIKTTLFEGVVFIEGFSALYMLSRHENTKAKFGYNLSRLGL